VQFSVHVERGGELEHHWWLADGPEDPRRALSVALLDACAGARAVVAYSASFERAAIERLAVACPDLGPSLMDLAERLVDLLPVVRARVYHPDFGGSFGLKAVLPALTGQGYDDLSVAGGGLASALLTRVLFEAMPDAEAAIGRQSLLAYCERDTWGLVLLLRRLRELARLPHTAS
jgi:hypothetical protein